MSRQRRHWFGDAFILVSPDQCDDIEGLSHVMVDYILPVDGRCKLTRREQLIVANAGPAAKLPAADTLDIYRMSCQRNFCAYHES